MSSPALPPHAYVDTPAAWSACLAHLRAQTQLAIDLESNSLYAYSEQICLIQISTRERDYIIDPRAPIELEPLGEIVADPSVEKVFHAAEYDLILMQKERGWTLHNLFDTMWAVRILGEERVGLANVLEARYGFRLNKKYQRANWCARPLKEEMLHYAQSDTHFLLRLRDDLWRELEEGGHAEEAVEIFAEASQVKIPDTSFDPDDFWRINGVRDLTPRGRAIMRVLSIFRDREAKRRNRPHFKVLSNKTLLSLAERAPQRHHELNGIKGMTRGVIRRYGNGILQAVREGLRAKPPRRPRNPGQRPSDEVVERYEALHTWRKETARARGVASDVVVSRDALWELAHANPQSEADLRAIDRLGPWRRAQYGAAILKVLSRRTHRRR